MLVNLMEQILDLDRLLDKSTLLGLGISKIFCAHHSFCPPFLKMMGVFFNFYDIQFSNLKMACHSFSPFIFCPTYKIEKCK